MRIPLSSPDSWIEVRDNLAPMDRYAVRDAPDVIRDDDGNVTVAHASENMWRAFLSRVITAWSFPDPIPSADPSVLERVPPLEEDQDALEEALRPRFDRVAGARRGNASRPPAKTSETSSAS